MISSVLVISPLNACLRSVINSRTHPAAYAFLSRIFTGEREELPKDLVDQWSSGPGARQQLLRQFVHKVYIPGASQTQNILRLQAWHKMRQATHEWRKNLAGFEWLTETEMAEKEKWSEQLEKFYMSVLWLSNIFGTKVLSHFALSDLFSLMIACT